MHESSQPTPRSQFSLRTMFIAMTLAAVACVIIRLLVKVPILGLLAMTYLPLMIIYGLIRGPFLWRRWRLLRRDYHAVAQQRQELLEEAGSWRSDDSNPPPRDPQSSA